MDLNNLGELQRDLANRSHWNIGFFVAGFLFWVFVTGTSAAFVLDVAKVYWLIGTFFIFPVAILASKIIGAEPFTKGNRLSDLVGYTHMSAIALSLPIVLASFVYYPEAMLLVMAICYCIDFYVMSWAFGSKIFGIHAAARMLLVSFIWFALPELRVPAIPAVVAIAYLATVLAIPASRNKWLQNNELRNAV